MGTLNTDDAGSETWVPGPLLPEIPGFRIHSMLGHGGMGCVYLAEHLKLERFVALKIVAMGAAASPDMLSRFRNESRSVAAVAHPGICQIYEVGESNGLPYISMEYIRGETLLHSLRTQLPSTSEAARLVIEIARAVEACHQAGILHRDLKPENVMLTHDRTVKVMDFGLAKRVQSEGEHKTQTGHIVGTPNYMPPEQASGIVKQLTPASDVYSIGAILYELLTGRPPFQTPDPMQTIMRVLTEEPISPRKLQPRIPVDLETICIKSLAKQPSKRYQTAQELADDLARFLESRPIVARRTPAWERCWKWIRRYPAYSALLATLLLAAVGAGLGVSFHVSRLQTELGRSERLFGNSQELGSWLVNEHIPSIARLRGGTLQQEQLVSKTLQHLRELESDIAADERLAEYVAQAYLRIAEVQSDPFFATDARLEQAISSNQRALELYENLEKTSTLEAQDTVQARIRILLDMVRLSLQLGHLEEAHLLVTRASQLGNEVDRVDAEQPLWNAMLEELQTTVRIQQGSLSHPQAYATYRRLYESGIELAARSPVDPELTQQLAQLCLRIDSLLAATATAEVAEFEDVSSLRIEVLTQAVSHLAELPDIDLRSIWTLARVQLQLSNQLRAAGKIQAADRQLKDAIEKQSRLVNEVPQSVIVVQSLLEFLDQQVRVELARPDLEAAFHGAKRYLEISEALYLSSPQEFRDVYRQAFEMLAKVQTRRLRYDDAAQSLGEALSLARKDPDATHRLICARLMRSQAELLVAADRDRSINSERLKTLRQAIQVLKESLEIYEHLGVSIESDPGSPFWQTTSRLHEFEMELEQLLLQSREQKRGSRKPFTPELIPEPQRSK